MIPPSALQRRHGPGTGASATVLPLTPLIDISLMLAVLLIAVMDAERSETNLPVQLPAAGSGQATTGGFTITIDAEGQVSLGGALVTTDALRAAAQGQQSAIIRADGAVEHRQVVAVVDVLRQAGVQRILYGTEPGIVEW